MAEDNRIVMMGIYFIFGALLVLSFVYVFNAAEFLNLDTSPIVEDVVNETWNDDWTDGATVTGDMNEHPDGYIYPSASATGKWSSGIIDIPRNRVLEATYIANMADGNGTITVYAWTSNTSAPPDESVSIEMESGANTRRIGFEERDFFQVNVSMTEQDGDNDRFPRLEYLNLKYELISGEQIGVSDSLKTVLTVLLWGLGVLLFVAGAYYRMKRE